MTEEREIKTSRKRSRLRFRLPSLPKLVLGPILIVGAIAAVSIFIWVFCRIEPGAGEIAVLIRKTGENLPPGQVIAIEERQKGIQLAVLSEGRYFRNPYTWSWKIRRILDVPAGKLGVMTRLYGQELPPGKIIAGDDQRGIMQEILRPGKYRINPYAFHVALFSAISINPGHVGVVTALTGKDVLNNELLPDERNTFMVKGGLKGGFGQAARSRYTLPQSLYV